MTRVKRKPREAWIAPRDQAIWYPFPTKRIAQQAINTWELPYKLEPFKVREVLKKRRGK